MENTSIISPGNASSANSDLDKIYNRKSDRVSRSFHSPVSMQTATNLVLAGHLKPTARPDSRFRRCPADIKRENALRSGRVELGRNRTSNRSRLYQPRWLLQSLARKHCSTVRLHHKKRRPNTKVGQSTLESFQIIS